MLTVTTVSGRRIPAPPRIRVGQGERCCRTDLRRLDAWLVTQAIAEAQARGDEYVERLFRASDPRKPKAAERCECSLYQFAEDYPEWDATTGERLR